MYYYTQMSVYNLGVVNSAQIHGGDNEPNDHMSCHMYNEGVARKSSNNVASHIMKTFKILSLLNDWQPGEELNIIFDTCLVQRQEQHNIETSSFSGANGILQKNIFSSLLCTPKTLQILSSMSSKHYIR